MEKRMETGAKGTEISVLTPTFNRAGTLSRLFESLRIQGIQNFEWLVVDDGSTDETYALIEKFEEERPGFPIRYFYQKNGGKHRAVNRGVREAAGEFIFIVDSDDYLLPEAMRHVTRWCREISADPKIAGVAGRRITSRREEVTGYEKSKKKELLSLNDSERYVTAPNNERKKYSLAGDQAEVYKKSVLEKFPFQEFAGENFLSEDSVWNLIAGRGYVLRWYDQPVYVCEYRADGLSAKVRQEGLEQKNFEGYSYRMAVNFRYAPNRVRKLLRLVKYYQLQIKKGYTLMEARQRLILFFHLMDADRNN